MIGVVLALLVQQDLVEKALAETNKERRQNAVAELRKLDFGAVEKAVHAPTYGATSLATGRIVARKSRTEHDGEEFRYAVRIPKAYDPSRTWPCLVTLHGTNRPADPEQGDAWMTVWAACAPLADTTVLIAPTTVRHTWSSRQGHSHVLTALHEMMNELNIDHDRVCLDGMSMGAGGTFDVAEYHPDVWAAIAPRCGAPDVRRKKDGTLVAMLCENFRNLPIYWVVGAKDEKIPIDIVRAAKDALTSMKVDLTYREYPDGDHDWGLEKDDVIAAWYAKQKRMRYPDEVVWKTYEKGFPGAYWIECTQRTDAQPILTTHLDIEGRESETRAEFRPPVVLRAKRTGNTIDITCEEAKGLRIWLDDAMVDLDKPVTVTVNGKKRFDAVAKRSVDVLIDEARRRHDRAMTFSAYLDVKP